MARRLSHGEHLLADGSNHWIMQQDRQLVIRVIRSTIENVRPDDSVPSPSLSDCQ
jgi:hypothetical protein